jgi:hypothetical protein
VWPRLTIVTTSLNFGYGEDTQPEPESIDNMTGGCFQFVSQLFWPSLSDLIVSLRVDNLAVTGQLLSTGPRRYPRLVLSSDAGRIAIDRIDGLCALSTLLFHLMFPFLHIKVGLFGC